VVKPVLAADFAARVGSFALEVALRSEAGILALLGPSGAGKTLTLQCLAGLRRPHAGRIVLGDRVLFDAARGIHVPPRQRRVGYVFQHYALFPHLTVAENLAFGLAGWPRDAARRRVAELLALLRLEELAARRPRELSGGQQQRVALGRALAPKPALLLLDEPLAALDPAIRSALAAELLALQRTLGLPMVLVTHDVDEAYTLSTRMVVLHHGRVLQAGPKEEVFHRPADATVARLVGMRNLFLGRIAAADARGLVVATPRFAVLAPPADWPLGARVQVGVRPEDVAVVGPGEAPPAEAARLEGWVVAVLDHGATRTALFKAGTAAPADARDYDLEVLLSSRAYRALGLAEGQRRVIAIPRAAVHVLGEEGAAI
jgi:molybdate transport system ATP-binding protein